MAQIVVAERLEEFLVFNTKDVQGIAVVQNVQREVTPGNRPDLVAAETPLDIRLELVFKPDAGPRWVPKSGVDPQMLGLGEHLVVPDLPVPGDKYGREVKSNGA